jgi:hypothetical protein
LPFSKRQNDAAPENPQDLYRNADLFKIHTQQYDPLDRNSDTEQISNPNYTMAIESSDDLFIASLIFQTNLEPRSNSTLEQSLQRKIGTPLFKRSKRTIHFSTWTGCLQPIQTFAVTQRNQMIL